MPIDAKDIVPSLWDVQAKPSPNNTWPLGSPSLAWSNLYLGPNGANAFDPATGNIGFFARTAAEIAASVTPTNFSYDPKWFDPRRYGAVANGVTDDTAAFQRALTVAGINGGTVRQFPGTQYLCTADLNVPVGQGLAVDVEGSGWTTSVSSTQGGILFSGASVTHGLYFNGSGSSFAGSVRNLNIQGTSGAAAGVTYSACNHPHIDRCLIQGFSGRAIYLFNTLVAQVTHTLVIGCGSATVGSIEVDATAGTGNSTTCSLINTRVSGGNTTVGALLIDRTLGYTISGGAYESAGPPIKISTKAETVQGCAFGVIQQVDLENPGNNNPYIDIGSGLSGGANVIGTVIQGCDGFASGTTQQNFAVRMANVYGCDLIENTWSQAGTAGTITNITQAASAVITISTVSGTNPFAAITSVEIGGVVGMYQINGQTGTVTATGGSSGAWTITVNINSSAYGAYVSGGNLSSIISTHELTGTNNFGVHIYPTRGSFGNAWPWVRKNGTQVMAAGAYMDWFSDSVPVGRSALGNQISGTTASILISTTQGGYYGKIGVNNGGATNFSTLTGGEQGMDITLWARETNTTIVNNAFGTANGFHNTSGSNITTATGVMYHYVHDGTMWVQV